jgi:Tfp pilus assembly protein PilO
MRASDRSIIFGVALLGLAIAFYMLVLGPKRDKASELGSQIDSLNASIAAANQQAEYGAQARQEFPKYYGRMVVLGKAVPAQSDTASMLVQLNSMADRSKVDLMSIALGQGSGGSASSSAPAPAQTAPSGAASTASSAASASSSTGSTTPSTGTPTSAPAAAPTSPAPATEASAANLPIGSVVGPAGLPTLPYDVGLTGSYFDVANFIGKVDGLVRPVDGGTQLSPDGRLFTVNGFALQINGTGASPRLQANFLLTAFSSGDQGLTAGASPTGPAPTVPSQSQAQPASAVVPK